MIDEQPKKRKMSKWIKIPLIIFGVLFLYFYIGAYFMEESKGRAFTTELIQVADGSFYDHSSKMEWDRPARPGNYDEPACSVYTKTKGIVEGKPYSYCTSLFTWTHGPGCSWWWFEFCDVYKVDDFILTQPELLGRILHVLQEPCAYLPTAEDIQKAEEKGQRFNQNLRAYYERASCDSGGGPMPIKVVINVRNDLGDVISQYQHLPPNRPSTIWEAYD